MLTHNDARISALKEIRQAFANGDDSAEAHAALGDIQFLYDWDWSGAEREYRRSLDLNPGFVPRATTMRRCWRRASASTKPWRCPKRRSASIPNRPRRGSATACCSTTRGISARAEAIAERIIAQEPGNPAGYVLGGRVAEAQGRDAVALTLIKQAWQLVGDGGVNLRVLVIRVQAAAGETEAARAARAELENAAAAAERCGCTREIAP